MRIFITILWVGLIGGMVGLVVEYMDSPDPLRMRLELTFLAFCGALVGGACMVWAFGRAGAKGWGLAALGAVLSTAIGGMAGALLVLPDLPAALVGMIFPFVALVEYLPSLPLWLAGMAGLHLAARALRRREHGEQSVSEGGA